LHGPVASGYEARVETLLYSRLSEVGGGRAFCTRFPDVKLEARRAQPVEDLREVGEGRMAAAGRRVDDAERADDAVGQA
jgi:hypothetical protein